MAFRRHQRMAHSLLQAGRQLDTQSLGIKKGRHQAAIVEISARAAGHVVDQPLFIEAGNDFGQLVTVKSRGTARFVADGQPNDEARAKWMVLNSDRSIAQIAYECGFTDCAHLVNWFRRTYHVTPAKLRRSHRELGVR
ncbi:AraC-like DNA-binding protein [Rhizobium leguminosarum]|uniref:AraC-like DNA-binding protein n=1 Tax=Rhizobium leguminosarum TaxID=384 RepID=A0A7Z0IXC3_RHILE|nr:AraC-like DNA-binding protein [Rhizobium leguminosarum]